MSLPTALALSGFPLFINQATQFFDIEDERGKDKPNLCLHQSAILGAFGSAMTIALSEGAKSISKLSPSLSERVLPVVWVVGGTAGAAGIYFKAHGMKYIWDKVGKNLSFKEKVTRAAIDGTIFVATGVITTAGYLHLTK